MGWEKKSPAIIADCRAELTFKACCNLKLLCLTNLNPNHYEKNPSFTKLLYLIYNKGLFNNGLNAINVIYIESEGSSVAIAYILFG